jgi:hypothetical protein
MLRVSTILALGIVALAGAQEEETETSTPMRKTDTTTVKATTTPVATKTSSTTKLTTTKTDTVTTTTTTITDCVCQKDWIHEEFKCNSSSPGFIKQGDYLGCPTLEALSACEVEPQQSWCPTTAATCLQQDGGAIGEGWAFCSPETQKPELPGCTCAQIWLNGQGENCQSTRNRQRVVGCPTKEELQECDPTYDGKAWCLTNEAKCLEQIDCPTCSEESEHSMEGDQWAYCDPDTQEAELPDCECEETWVPDKVDCPDLEVMPRFASCPTIEELGKCNKAYKTGFEDEPYCKTKQEKCKQQSKSEVYDNMVGDGWAYCNPKTEATVLPQCECKAAWNNDDGVCKNDPFPMEGCPTTGQLHICDHTSHKASQSWCETTYENCEQQNYEAKGNEWVYCNHVTQESELADCECMDVWTYNEDGTDCADGGYKMRGCPDLSDIRTCEPRARDSWCLTKDMTCKQQTAADETLGDGWVFCDPATQGAIRPSDNTSLAIGITFFVTVMACTGIFLGMLYGYRKYTKRKREEYTKQLLGGNDTYVS